jgi:hypothetical protein
MMEKFHTALTIREIYLPLEYNQLIPQRNVSQCHHLYLWWQILQLQPLLVGLKGISGLYRLPLSQHRQRRHMAINPALSGVERRGRRIASLLRQREQLSMRTEKSMILQI